MKKMALTSLAVLLLSFAANAAPADKGDSLANDLAWTIIEKATRSTDMNARAEAVRALQFIDARPTAALLADALADAQWNVRKHAITGLVRLGDPKAVGLLEECLYNPSLPLAADALDLIAALPAASGRAMFMKALMTAGNPARQLLVDNVLNQEPAVIADWFAEGFVTDPAFFIEKFDRVRKDAVPGVLQNLTADKRPAVFIPAVKLAMAKGLKIDAAVLNGMLKSKDVELKYQAAEALARQGAADAVSAMLPLADGSKDDRVRFLKAAAAAPSPAIQDRVWAMMKPELEPELVHLIYMCFPATTNTEVLKAIDADIVSTEAGRRPAAVRAVGRVKGTRSLPQLNDLIVRDGNWEVRVAAALAIGDLGQVESVPVLGKATNDIDRRVKMAALEALGKIKDRSVISVASYSTFDTNPEVKTAALKAVAEVNHKDAIGVLRVAADDPNAAIRSMVLGAMMRLDRDAALGRFERAMLNLGQATFIEFASDMKEDFAPFAKLASTSQHQWAREAVLKSMKFMPQARVTLLQEMALASNYEDTRIEALNVMAMLEPAIAWENASAMVKDGNARIRAAAFRVVGMSANPAAHELLMRGVEDPDEYVQAVAASAIAERAAVKKAPGGKSQPAAKPAKRK